MAATDPIWVSARRRWIAASAGIRFASVLGPALMVIGVAVLAVRMATSIPAGDLLALPLLCLFLISWALRRAIGRAPAPEALRALADAGQHFGGRLLVEDLPGGEVWAVGQPVAPPRLRWDPRRSGALMGAGILVVAGAYLAPVNQALARFQDRLDLGPVIAPMREQLTVLEETRSAEPEEVARMRRRLEEAAEEARGRDPARAYETLDHLRESMARVADRAASEDVDQIERMAAARDLASALDETHGKLDPQTLAAALEALKKLAEDAAQALPPGLELPPELAEALANLEGLDPDLLKQLAERFGEGMDLTFEDLQRLAEARLIDPAMLQQCEGGMGGQGKEDLMALLLGEGEDGQGEDDLALLLMLPGAGGISKGPGAAELRFSGETEDAGQRFEAEALPPGRMPTSEPTHRVGVAALDPTRPLDQLAEAGTGAMAGATGEGGQAADWNVPPRHRAAVRRYFDRD